MKIPPVPGKPAISDDTAELRALHAGQEHRPMMAELYRQAKAQLRNQRKHEKAKAGATKPEEAAERLLHEVQVHQIELEMQNAELQKARDELEVMLEKYTDLYDFAPVGFLSLNESGMILEANLTGAVLLGQERSRLIHRHLRRFVSPASRTVFEDFLKKVFAGTKEQTADAQLLKEDGNTFWAGLRATCAVSLNGTGKWCRLALGDITVRRQVEEAHRRAAAIESSNEELRQEIARRKVIAESLRKSERHQSRMLDQSRVMQEQLRQLSRQILHAQEEERKRISRELHDVIAQTLTGINIRLATLKKEAGLNLKGFDRNIASAQRLVAKSVDIVHQFARELRPPLLDDLGLIPALHSFVKMFSKRTRLQVRLKSFAGVERLDNDRRTILYRVAQEALTNVARHAQASRVEVNVQKLSGSVCMKIHDNGKSFQAKQALDARGRKRLGLLGMRERLEMVRGHLEIESAPGKGTTITASIPLTKPRAGGGGALMEFVETKKTDCD